MASPKPFLPPGFYRTELNRTAWVVPERYQDLKPIGQGNFGTVCSAVNVDTNQRVALKKLHRPFQSHVHAKRAYREVKLLKLLSRQNVNVIELLDVFTPADSYADFQDVYIVTGLMPTDLDKVIKIQAITDEQVKLLIYQILRGLKYIHSAGVIHRDLKPSNIGISSDLDVKHQASYSDLAWILDLGLGRKKKGEMTGYITTRYWRAPEVLLLWMHYGQKVDIWSVGCIMAELLTGKVIFPGNDYRDHLNMVLQICGSPDEEMMSKIDSEDAQRYIRSLPQFPKKNFYEYFVGANPVAVNLLDSLLCLDPDRRPSAKEALNHPYFERLHQPDDEPDCAVYYDDSLEEQDVDKEGWRKLVYEEILQSHPPSRAVSDPTMDCS